MSAPPADAAAESAAPASPAAAAGSAPERGAARARPPADLSAMVDVAADAVDRVIITPAESLQKAIATRAFGAVPVAGRPAKAVHDSLAGLVYAGVRAGTGAAGHAAGALLDRAAQSRALPELSATRQGRKVIALINGLIGDLLVERGSPLAWPMELRLNGAPVELKHDRLQDAYPRATGKLAVFVHGLAESDDDWRPRSRRWFGARLKRELGITPLVVRYNSGLHISANGRALAGMLRAVAGEWPVPVTEISLIGHSMGGLVIRSACLQAEGTRWVRLVRNVVTLGTPHGGAPLEKAVHVAAWTLRRVPEAAPLAGILELRSAGIRDLRFGYLSDADWGAEDPQRLYHDGRQGQAPLLPRCRYTLVSATLTADHRNPAAKVVGDLLVTHLSASALEVDADAVIHLGGMSHLELLYDERVYAVIKKALSAGPVAAARKARATLGARVEAKPGARSRSRAPKPPQ